jgi:hypothetical protein
MIKVFENFDFSRVGQIRSLLESNDIHTFVKNEFTSGVVGEVPFVEACPQLFILDEADLVRARRLIQQAEGDSVAAADWTCSQCQSEVEGQFGQCWNCGAMFKHA